MYCCPDERNAKIFNWQTLEGVVSPSHIQPCIVQSRILMFNLYILASAALRTKPTARKTPLDEEAAAVPSPRAIQRLEVTESLEQVFLDYSTLILTVRRGLCVRIRDAVTVF